jgi:histidinol-phosphatase
MRVGASSDRHDGWVETDLQLAQRAAITGAAVALPHFAALAELPRELKSDGTVVTAADRAVESAMRKVLAAARPGDAVLGEEQGESAGEGSRRWIIDPIDGTALFVDGDDRWLILIALEEEGEIVAAVAAHPAQGSIWWASRGGGAFEGRIIGGRVVAETRIGVSKTAGGLGGGTLAGGGPEGGTLAGVRLEGGGLAGGTLAVVPENWSQELVAPLKAITEYRRWTIHPALMVARGDLDVGVQTAGQIWDFAAPSLILTEAGGSYSGINGNRRPGPGASVYARDEVTRLAALDVLIGKDDHREP